MEGPARLLINVIVADPLRTAAESAVYRGYAARVVGQVRGSFV
jgi:hypothetical protein